MKAPFELHHEALGQRLDNQDMIPLQSQQVNCLPSHSMFLTKRAFMYLSFVLEFLATTQKPSARYLIPVWGLTMSSFQDYVGEGKNEMLLYIVFAVS